MAVGLTPRRRSTTAAAALLAVPILAALALIALTPQHIETARPDLVFGTLHWLQHDLGLPWLTMSRAERLGNVLLYVPIGILAYLILPRRAWFAALLVGPIISICVELAQLTLLTERTATLWDVAANSIGATIGVAAASLFTLVFARAPRSRPAPTTA